MNVEHIGERADCLFDPRGDEMDDDTAVLQLRDRFLRPVDHRFAYRRSSRIAAPR